MNIDLTNPLPQLVRLQLIVVQNIRRRFEDSADADLAVAARTPPTACGRSSCSSVLRRVHLILSSSCFTFAMDIHILGCTARKAAVQELLDTSCEIFEIDPHAEVVEAPASIDE